MMTSKSLFSGKNAWETTVDTSCEFTVQNEILPLFDHLFEIEVLLKLAYNSITGKPLLQ